MFINIGTDCNVKDRIIDNINGTNIVLFGHTSKQYKQRIDKLRRNFKIDKLDYNYLVNEALQAIRDNYNECLTKKGERVWKAAVGEFTVNCDKQLYKMEVSVLIKSAKVAWEKHYPQIPAEDYREYYLASKAKNMNVLYIWLIDLYENMDKVIDYINKETLS